MSNDFVNVTAFIAVLTLAVSADVTDIAAAAAAIVNTSHGSPFVFL